MGVEHRRDAGAIDKRTGNTTKTSAAVGGRAATQAMPAASQIG
jgi:hypothetical protein